MSRFKPKKEIIHEDIDKELMIDSDNLNAELMDQPLYFRKWNNLKAEVHKKAKLAKLQLEEKRAELHLKYSADGTGKKVKEVESTVMLDPEVKKLERDLIDAEELTERFEGIVRAFIQRHEALKELSTNKRKELID